MNEKIFIILVHCCILFLGTITVNYVICNERERERCILLYILRALLLISGSLFAGRGIPRKLHPDKDQLCFVALPNSDRDFVYSIEDSQKSFVID